MYQASYTTSLYNDSVTWIFIAILVILCFLKFFYNERLFFTSVSLFSEKHTLVFYSKDRKSSVVTRYDSILFLAINVLTCLLLLQCIFHKTSFEPQKILFLSILITGYAIFDYLLKKGVSVLFGFESIQHNVTYFKTTYFNNAILWILPFLLIYFYSSSFKESIRFLIMSIFLVINILRYILTILKNKKHVQSHLFYIILYLCTLEIAPFIFLIKWVN